MIYESKSQFMRISGLRQAHKDAGNTQSEENVRSLYEGEKDKVITLDNWEKGGNK